MSKNTITYILIKDENGTICINGEYYRAEEINE